MNRLPDVPGFDILNQLGGGSVTAVFAAREIATNISRAVKVLRPNWEEQTAAIRLMQREARAGLAVQHTHLAEVHHAHVMRAPRFLVMDLLDGESLRKHLGRNYRLQTADAIRIARQTAEALSALHRVRFIHGDVKPDNIQVGLDGNATLIDLGFAHRPGENKKALSRGYVLGTVEYLAPELCEPTPVDAVESDLFSLGATMFEMLTGRLPYPRESIRAAFQRRRNEPPLDVNRSAPSLHPALRRIVSGLMSRDPADRPRLHSVVQQLIALEIASLQFRRAA